MTQPTLLTVRETPEARELIAAAGNIADTLPNKPSELLRLALDDLWECREDPRYGINMDVWFESDPKLAACQVCLAGAVLVKHCGVQRPDVPISYQHYDFPLSLCNKLVAINHLRAGSIGHAFFKLGLPVPTLPSGSPLFMYVTSYHANPLRFREDMELVIAKCQACEKEQGI